MARGPSSSLDERVAGIHKVKYKKEDARADEPTDNVESVGVTGQTWANKSPPMGHAIQAHVRHAVCCTSHTRYAGYKSVAIHVMQCMCIYIYIYIYIYTI